MSLKPIPPQFKAETEYDDCTMCVCTPEDGRVSIDGVHFHHSLIPDIIEFLKIAQEWIDANKDNA